MSTTPEASVVIATRNRKSALRDAIRSALAQTVAVEIIVRDDASTDGTAEMLAAEFPQICHHRSPEPRGPAFQRNAGILAACAPVAFPIDDDATFASSETVAQTLRDFDHARVAAVGIPFVNVHQDPRVMQQACDPTEPCVIAAFVGAAHAVRRDVFLAIGGFREHFFYMVEEGDLCLRLLNAGYVTRAGRADPMHHFESPVRDSALADYCGRRNDVLFFWHNVPMPYLPLHLAGNTLHGLRRGFSLGRPRAFLRGTAAGFLQVISGRHARAPVANRIYRLHRQLRRSGQLPLAAIEAQLPPLP